MVKLTIWGLEIPVIVNSKNIKQVRRIGATTKLFFYTGATIVVNESFKEIFVQKTNSPIRGK